MKVEFGSDTLADAGRGGVVGLRVVNTRAVQSADLIRSEAPFLADRKNRTVEVSFTTYTEHATVAAAEEHMFDHETDLAGQADLKITIGTEVRQYDDALLISLEMQQLGLTTIQSYTFRGTYSYEPSS